MPDGGHDGLVRRAPTASAEAPGARTPVVPVDGRHHQVQATSEVQLVHVMALPRLRPPRCLQRPAPLAITVLVFVAVLVLIGRSAATDDVTAVISALVGALCAASGSRGTPPHRRRRK
jgi:hypothetical protein